MAVYSWASSDNRCIHAEDSTILGDQDKDSSPPTYSTRTLVILASGTLYKPRPGQSLDYYGTIHHTLRFYTTTYDLEVDQLCT